MALGFFKLQPTKAYPTKFHEPALEDVRFNVFKFNHRIKPRKTNRIKIIGCFSEFGCEVFGCMYCIPRIIRRYPGDYIIAMGWYGREYLYRHLVDEFWEIQPELMWLRNHSRAFHHISRNLSLLERAATQYGQVIPSAAVGKYAVCNFCRTCGKYWHDWRRRHETCPACNSTVIIRSVFSDINTYKQQAVRIPYPSESDMAWAKRLLPPNCVGIFARNRTTYGRNLDADFYINLIRSLERQGYAVVWLGERQTTLPCPLPHVLDFSNYDEARDIQKTLSIISQLRFTIQFWTASTRLSGMVGTPFILFESPEQIYASLSGTNPAQEGKRLELTSFGPKKIVIAHYKNVVDNPQLALKVLEQAVEELESGNYEDIIGLVENPEFCKLLQQEHMELLT